MEPTTIGKRIMTLRKSRSMTQDQLAEKLGVSAQAVSKWENEISCPDISLLPKLAAVFQITTDSLLGVPEKTEIAPAVPKHNGVYVNIGDDESEEQDEERNGFTFQFDLNNNSLPWFATAVLLFAVCLLLNRTILSGLGHAGIWELLWPSALLAWGVSSLCHRITLWSVGMTGFGGYYLLVNMHLLQPWTILNKGILIPLLLVVWAVSMLIEHFRGGRTKAHAAGSSTSGYRLEGGMIDYGASFGSERVIVEEMQFCGGSVDVSFGDYIIDLTGCGTVEPGSVLSVGASFGTLVLLVPKHWRIRETAERNFASVSTHGAPDENADQLLIVESGISFGSLDIRW